eukprot:4313338-Prorocentrum_lima.AAC.1
MEGFSNTSGVPVGLRGRADSNPRGTPDGSWYSRGLQDVGDPSRQHTYLHAQQCTKGPGRRRGDVAHQAFC